MGHTRPHCREGTKRVPDSEPVATNTSEKASPQSGSSPEEATQGARKPIIFAVDDDLGVLGAVARDLRREYGEHYRILRADSGERALSALQKAKLGNEQVALFLADQRMPHMSGLEFLGHARELFPDAKRVLLTAYADSQASIQAINETRLDYYLMKPWDPPEERLYPVLTDLLDDWRADFRPAFTGLTLIGHPYSAASHLLREFLARNLVPYRWLDVETATEAEELLTIAAAAPEDLPVLLLADGTALVKPDTATVARSIGLKTAPAMQLYDLVIVGAGPAGLAAAVYGASEGLSTLMIESHSPGGQAGMSSRIENYLGFPSGLSGAELSRRAATQARRFGAEILTPTMAVGLRREDPYRFVELADGREVGCRALLVATGISYRMIDVPGADRLAGSGVYYGAAITEAMSARGGHVFVIGGGNSAGQAAMYLSSFAATVTMLVRGTSLAASMSRYLIAQIEQTPNIAVQPRRVVVEVRGEERLEEVTICELDSQQTETLPAVALFVFIGASPRTGWLTDVVSSDPQGYLNTGPQLTEDGSDPPGWNVQRRPFWLETSVPGVFAAGDVRTRSVKRIASAVGEGAMAVQFIHQHLAGG